MERAQQHLANERTFLSWMRTSIALVGLGFIISRFGLFLREFSLLADVEGRSGLAASQITESSISPFFGLSLVALGVALILYALKNFADTKKDIESGRYVPKSNIIHIAGIALAVFGVVMVAYLLIVSVA